jgi:hypothetical protein
MPLTLKGTLLHLKIDEILIQFDKKLKIKNSGRDSKFLQLVFKNKRKVLMLFPFSLLGVCILHNI